MKNLSFIFSCLVACASTSLFAQANLGSVDIGGNSTTTITATVITPGTLSSIAVTTWGAANLDFTDAGGGTCSIGTSYAANATCTVNVKFAPTAAGARYGGVKLFNQGGSIATQSYVQGTGVAPQTIFFTGAKGPTQSQGGNFYINPQGMAADGANNIYIAVGGFNTDRYGDFVTGYLEKDGEAVASNYGGPSGPGGVAVDGAGNLYDSSYTEFVLKSDGTFAGFVNNINVFTPVGRKAVDGSGNLYVTCAAGICKETRQLDGTYIESAVSSGISATSLAVDATGNVYAANGSLYKFTLQGGAYTQSVIGTIAPVIVAVDFVGNVYCSDSAGDVYKESLQSDDSYVQSLLLAGAANRGYFSVDSNGNLSYFSMGDTNNPYNLPSLHEAGYQLSSPPTLSFANTGEGATTGAQTVKITNSGNAPLNFSEVTYPVDFPESSTGTTDCETGTTLAPNANCTLTIKFAPVSSLNGSPSALLSESVTITTNTLNAPSTQQSIIVTGTETTGTVATPVFSLPAGVYNTVQTVSISDATPGATIYYTLNGSQPTTSSMRYTKPVAVKIAETLKAIAMAPNFLTSSTASAYYALTALTPVISPAAGTYSGAQTVTISTASPIEFIFYTTGGTYPTTSSAHYTGPITVSSSKEVIAFAAQTGFLSSPFVIQKFNITTPAVTPALSIASGTDSSDK